MKTELTYLFILIMLFSSCTATKFLPEGEIYYEGSSIDIVSEKKLNSYDINEPEEDIEEVFREDPNLKILGSRPRVWFYHLAGDLKKEKGFRYWMKYKLGERPVYLSEVKIQNTRRLIENRLALNGYFDYRVTYEIDSGKNKGEINYLAEVDEPYTYDSIGLFAPDSVQIKRTLNGFRENGSSMLNPGSRYDFEDLQNERQQLELYLRNNGYYYFDDRFILYEADSTIGNYKVNLYPTFKDKIEESAFQLYKIVEVNIYTDYHWASGDSTSQQVTDIATYDNLNFIGSLKDIRPDVIANHVGFRPGDMYNRQTELNTLNRLIQLDIFQYVNVAFEKTGSEELRANIYLSPAKKKSLRATLEGVSTSNNFVGPHLTGTFMNRNFLDGAERFELNLNVGYEWQFGGGFDQRLSNYEVGLESVLTVPRLIQPFNIDYRSSRYIPLTKFKAGMKFQRRVQYYQMNSINISYGFEWRETSTKRHTLYPVNLKFIRLGRRTEEFDSLLQNDPYLQRSFEDQYILGSSYSYYYSSLGDKTNKTKRHNFYFNGNLDLSGNLLHLTQNLIGSPPTDTLGNYTLFGETYSQYVRASVDFRHYWRLDRNNTLVARFMTGAGYAFGNSVTLPYSMQFATGGANSLRAFRARSVGPGNFSPSDTVTFIDQTADIKLELNLEYRFTILGALKGGLFVDAGNIWTFREDPNRPGGTFKWGNVLDQLAVGTGIGIRYDFQFFILRMDWGIPIRLAYQYTDEEGNPANFPVRPWDGAWLKRYLVWNIAIGYPF